MLYRRVYLKLGFFISLITVVLVMLLASGCAGPQGIQGLQGIQGVPGISITWRGSLATAPVSPQLNDAYYNTADAKSYIWDGDSWETLAQDGAQGPQGIQGIQGPQGTQGEQGIQGIQGEQGYGFAALVVAAADSLDQDADYVCNGTDDQVEINAAINALPANGGSVYLREGTYIVSTSIIISKSNVALIGTGPSTVIKIKNGKNADIDVIYALDKSNLLVKNLRIDGNKTNQATGLMYGIIFSGVEYSKIVDCWAGNLTMYAIGLISSNYNTVSGNTCQGNSSHGILIALSNGNTVTGNTCRANVSNGIVVNSSSNNTISSNACLGNSSNGIRLDGSSSNTVTGNTCQDNSSHGIYIYNSSNNNAISGNTCQANSTQGILLDSSSGNTVTGNTFQGNGNNGIYIYSSSDNNTISSNACQGNGNNGIYVSESSDNTVTGNTCQDNTYDGISLYFANNTAVSGNTCHYNGQYGIWLISSSNNTISGNTVQGNSLADGTKSGIFLSGNSDYNNIQGNTVRKGTETNKQQYGIRIETGLCEYNLVANNDCYYGGETKGIQDDGSNTNFGAGNRNNDGSWSTTPN